MLLLQREDTIKVLPGAIIPADGIVISGTTHVNESLLTGESVPVSKKKDSLVYAGTVNQFGVCMFRFLELQTYLLVLMTATKISGETAFDEISKKLKETQLKKATIEKITDKISGTEISIFFSLIRTGGFVVFVVVFAILTFTLWMLLTSFGVVNIGDQANFPFSLKFALVETFLT